MGFLSRQASLLALLCGLALAPGAAAAEPVAGEDGAALEAACGAGDASACLTLGQHSAAGDGPGQDLSRALSLFQEACAQGLGAGCYAAGAQLYIGRGAQADVPGAVGLFRQGCDLGDGDACLRLAAELAFPDFGAPDTDGALAAYARACEAGRLEGCAEAGMEPPGAAVAEGPERAVEAAGVPVAPVEADRDAAVIVTGFAAPAEDEAPLSASGPSFAAEALPDLDFGAAIAGLDTLPEAEAVASEAAEVTVTDRDVTGDSQPSEEDLALAAERQGMAEACGRSDLGACEIFAAWLRDGTGGEADPVRARRIFSVICTEGSVKGCYELAWMMYDGAQVGDAAGRGALELSRARFLFSDTCKAGVTEACLQAGDMRRHGEGGPLDLAGAARFYGIACAAGIEPGCAMAADVTPAEEAVDPSADTAAAEQEGLPADDAAPEDLVPAEDEPVSD